MNAEASGTCGTCSKKMWVVEAQLLPSMCWSHCKPVLSLYIHLSGVTTRHIWNVITLLSGLSTMIKTMKMPLCLALLTACLTLSGPSLITRPSDTISNNWAHSLLLDGREQFVANNVVAKSTSWPTRVFFCSNENCCNKLKVNDRASYLTYIWYKFVNV
jgi:hypothetical protein